MKESGIYIIKFNSGEYVYIGSSCNLKNRFNNHLNKLKNNKHYNPRLQSIYNKYGNDNLHFSILEYCDIDILLEREQFFIDKCENSLLNTDRIVDYNNGYRLRKEARNNISKGLIGKSRSLETRKKISLSHIGRKVNIEVKEKMSKAQLHLSGKKINSIIDNENYIELIEKFNNGKLPIMLAKEYNIKPDSLRSMFRGEIRKNLHYLINKEVLSLYKDNYKKLYRKKLDENFNFIKYFNQCL